MRTHATVVADSIYAGGPRLLTFEVTYPRIILPEVNTHRALSRCSASTRAIPVQTMIDMVLHNPYVPSHWGINGAGMVAKDVLDEDAEKAARQTWFEARDSAVLHCRDLVLLSVHKQVANHLLGPFLWQTTIITGTEWDHFFALRTHESAHPEFRRLAICMQDAMASSVPRTLTSNDTHLPYVLQREIEGHNPIQLLSAGRVAKITVGKPVDYSDPNRDIARAYKMMVDGHMSPFEHQAFPIEVLPSNLKGWTQYRKLIPHEGAYHKMLKEQAHAK